MKFRRIPSVIEAHQFLRHKKPWPKGVCNCEESGFIGAHLHTIHGPILIGHGDWVTKERDGKHFYPIADEVLKATYRRV